MSSDIRIWVVETLSKNLAARHYELQKSSGDIVAEVSTEATVDALSASWPNLAKQVRNYLDGYYPEYKKGRDLGQLSADQNK